RMNRRDEQVPFTAHQGDAAARPLPVLTAAEMREMERITFGPGGVQERVVLESAGRAVAMAVARDFPEGRVVAALGRGNNGGDGIVALRTLQAWGREILAFPVGGHGLPQSLTHGWEIPASEDPAVFDGASDRKSTRLNSSHVKISYAVFCLKKKNKKNKRKTTDTVD